MERGGVTIPVHEDMVSLPWDTPTPKVPQVRSDVVGCRRSPALSISVLYGLPREVLAL